MNPKRPLLFAVKRYALHDGPHIRTTVFFKGCPLRCFWCHNPEGIEPRIEVVTVAEKCIGCRECLHCCPEDALSLSAAGIERREEACTACMACVEICPSLAQEALGWHGDFAEVMAEIEKDLPFYDQAGGGVTFSGGEPLQQAEPLLELLRRCGELGIHRAVDTTGFAASETLLAVAEHAELFLYDLKHMDSDKHRLYTGVGNERILENLKKLSEKNITLRIRLPLLLGINDDEDNIRALGRFATGLTNLSGIDILPYHRFAASKYQKLGENYRGGRHHTPDGADIARVRSLLEKYGHRVGVGG